MPERIEENKRRKEEKKKWAEFEKEVMRVEAERNKKLQKQLRKQLHESQKQLCEATTREEEAKDEVMLQTWLQKAKKKNAEVAEPLRLKRKKRREDEMEMLLSEWGGEDKRRQEVLDRFRNRIAEYQHEGYTKTAAVLKRFLNYVVQYQRAERREKKKVNPFKKKVDPFSWIPHQIFRPPAETHSSNEGTKSTCGRRRKRGRRRTRGFYRLPACAVCAYVHTHS